jgi:hypothetical protein
MIRNEQTPYARWLALMLVALAAYRVWAAQLVQLELFFDEAYYFGWAQSLEWGYYSKPPMVGWLIWLTTHIGGDSEPWVRAASTVLYPASAWMIFLTGRRLFDARAGFWAALAFITLPMVSFGAWLITTDAALLFFWSLALYCLTRALDGNAWRYWLGLGLALGLGGLSKYSMVFFAVGGLVLLAVDRDARGQLANPRLYAAIALAALVFAPNLWWNAQNQFVSVQHTAEIAQLDRDLLHPDKLGEFFGAQFGVMGPLLFAALLCIALRHGRALLSDAPLRLAAAFSLPVLGAFLVLALLSRAFANWGAMAYVAGCLLVAGWLARRERLAWLKVGIALNLLAAVFLYHYHAIMGAAGVELTRRADPYARITGWRGFGAQAQAFLVAHPGARLLGDDRKYLAELIYYIRPHPFNARMYNPAGTLDDHYALKHDLKADPAGSFVFISRFTDAARLRRDFAQVRELGEIVQPVRGHSRLTARVYLVAGFRGYGP